MKKIICPVDFSDNSLDAARFALRFAIAAEAKIKFIYVSSVLVPTGGLTYGITVDTPSYHLKLRKEELEDAINELYKDAKLKRDSKMSVCEAVDYASLVHGITETAEKFKADLIIMGTRGAAGLKRIFMGSVTASVLENAPCPVMAVPPRFSAKFIRRVGMATELTDIKKEVKRAVDFVKIFGAKLDVFHIGADQPKDIKKLTAELKEKTGYEEITYHEVVPKYEGDITGGLNQYAAKQKPDVLIMFYTQRNWFDKLTQISRTKEMLFHADTAVLSFRREKKKK
jgi:nucleotide-binding universal stress UspA family protein